MGCAWVWLCGKDETRWTFELKKNCLYWKKDLSTYLLSNASVNGLVLYQKITSTQLFVASALSPWSQGSRASSSWPSASWTFPPVHHHYQPQKHALYLSCPS